MITFHFRSKRLKRVPKKQRIVCLLLGIIFLSLFINLLFPDTNMLQQTQRIELDSYQIEQKYSFSKHSLTRRYNVYTDESNYYFLFSRFSDEYERFRDEVEPALEGNQMHSASLMVSTRQTLQDKILNRHRILSFNIDGTEYLSLEHSKSLLISEYIGAWVGFLLIGGSCTGSIVLMGLGYGVFELDRSPKRKSNKTIP